jgi:hypothetical protein
MTWEVPEIWEDGECWIIGGGPSMPRQFGVPESLISEICLGKTEPHEYSPWLCRLWDKHVIGVNNAYLIGDWLDCLFFGDGSWYLSHQQRIAAWTGLKVTCWPRIVETKYDPMQSIRYLSKDVKKMYGLTRDKSKVSWNTNSGASAIGLAVHFGVKRIMLLGFDMNLDQNKISHWHGSHGAAGKKQKKSPPFIRHLKGFPQIAEDAKVMGVEILNVNPDSAIEAFPKVRLRDIL